MNSLLFIMYLGMAVSFFLFTKNILQAIFRTENESLHKKRLRALDFNNNRIGQTKDSDLKGFLEKTTSPLTGILSPKLSPKKLKDLERDLAYVGWDKVMHAQEFRVLQLIMAAIAIPVGLFMWTNVHVLFGIVIIGAGTVLMPFMLSNSVKNKKEKIFSEFPEFIQLVQGYLVADMPLTEAIRSTINYVGNEWKEYLSEFVANSHHRSLDEALDRLQYQVNIQEVSELLNLVRVSMKQGVDVQESFENQKDKVHTMQMDVVMGKIEKRKMMTMLLQGPLLLTIIIAFGLPTIHAMINLG